MNFSFRSNYFEAALYKLFDTAQKKLNSDNKKMGTPSETIEKFFYSRKLKIFRG